MPEYPLPILCILTAVAILKELSPGQIGEIAMKTEVLNEQLNKRLNTVLKALRTVETKV